MTEEEITKKVVEVAGQFGLGCGEEWQRMAGKFFKNARTFKDFTALTPESIEAIYLAGYTQYNAGRFEDAEKIFQLLSVLNHFEKKFWKALAAARQMQHKYEQAVAVYGYLGILDLQDPWPPLQSAKCLMRLRKFAEAETALRASMYLSEEKPDKAKVFEEASSLMALLEKKKVKKTKVEAPAAEESATGEKEAQ